MALREIDDVLSELGGLLKRSDVGAELTSRGINVSLALVAVDAIAAYVHGDKATAHEDFATVAEEIASRMMASATMPGTSGQGGEA